MSRSGPPMVLAPKDWVEATSLTFSSRDKTLKRVDEAYALWFEAGYRRHEHTYLPRRVDQMTEPQRVMLKMTAKALRENLEYYLAQHGSVWKQAKRNRESNGLMEFIYKKVCEPIPDLLRKEQDRQNADSRFGVLYLFGNIDIQVDMVKAGLDFVSGSAGAISTLVSTDFNNWEGNDDGFGSKFIAGDLGSDTENSHVGRIKTATRWVFVGGKNSKGELDGEMGVPDVVDLVNDPIKSTLENTRERMGEKTTFARTSKAMNAYAGPGAKNKFIKGAKVAGSAIIDTFKKLYDLLESLVIGLVKWVYEKFKQALDDPLETLYGQIKFWLKAVIKNVAQAAAPFVGAGFDIADGLIESFKAIKTKVGAWMLRKKINIMEGHPSRLCERIEGAMENAILAGLWSVIKGAVQMALAATIPGIQSLVSALTSGVEAIIKLVLKIMERGRIKRFLQKARKLYEEERLLRIEKFDDKANHMVTTMHTSGGLIHDIKRFNAFYKEGCDASPIIAMLTINTGLCGSQWQMQDLLSIPGPKNQQQKLAQEQFDTGTKYFDKLKKYGYGYLKDCGFDFVANGRDKGVIQALLSDAKTEPGKNRRLLTSITLGPPPLKRARAMAMYSAPTSKPPLKRV